MWIRHSHLFTTPITKAYYIKCIFAHHPATKPLYKYSAGTRNCKTSILLPAEMPNTIIIGLVFLLYDEFLRSGLQTATEGEVYNMLFIKKYNSV